MAASITHVAITQRLYQKCFADRDPAALFVGTTFPDIRKLAGLRREQTHRYDGTVAELKTADDFMAGVRLHWLVDETHSQITKSSRVERYFKLPPYPTLTAIKYIEDELAYNWVEDWDRIIAYYNSYFDAENKIGAAPAQLETWHHLLQQYFSQPPSAITRASGANMPNRDVDVSQVNQAAARAGSNPAITKLLRANLETTVSQLAIMLAD
jgi:hypothetical protein